MATMIWRICLAVFCMSSAWYVSDPPQVPTTQKHSQEDLDFLCRPGDDRNWSLTLDSVQLTSNGITEINATLRNLSNKAVIVDRRSASNCLFKAARIWTSKKSGSYSMCFVGKNSGSRVRPMCDIVTIEPNESIVLKWPSRKPVPDSSDSTRAMSRSEYGPIFHTDYYLRSEPGALEKLDPGEFVVDATIELSFAIVTPEGMRGVTEFVRVSSNNKVWLTVGE